MAIPDYQSCMLPLLEAISDQRPHAMREITDQLARQFNLTDAERSQLQESGQQTVIYNRVAWAKTYLNKARLLTTPTRGKIQISAEGLNVLQEKPPRIDYQFLMRFPSFVEFRKSRSATPDSPSVGQQFVLGAILASPRAQTSEESLDVLNMQTPEEAIAGAYDELRAALADDLLDRVKACSWQFFEKLVVQLVVAMGYGGSLADVVQAVGKSGDGGIDGIIKEDKLGLDVVCIQAKRWEETVVGRPEVQKFAGSMEGFRARKGMLITTSSFSKDAKEYVKHIERKIVLIDGKLLSEFMIDYGIGVTTSQTYTTKKVDSDFFGED